MNITNLGSLCSGITLTNIKIYKLDAGVYSNVPLPASNNPYIDGSNVRLLSLPTPVTDNVTLKFTPYFFDQMKAQNSQIFIAMRFDVSPACRFLNNTQALPDYDNLDGIATFYNPVTKVQNMNTTPFDYDYNSTKVTQPKLRDAILEVAVWSGETGIDTSTGTSSALFSDDVDAVTAPAGWSILGIADRFSGTPHIGAASIRLRDVPSSMVRIIPTTGYSAITVSFDMGSKVNHAGRYMRAEWSPDGGTTWNLLKQINNGDPEDDNDLHPFSYSLPASADNNANFALRYILNANVPGEKGYVDNILVGGIPD
jgi:hypothetical protein